MGSEPLSRIEKILSNIVGEGSYELELPLSDAEEILQTILNDTTTDVAARDRMCEILLCILNNEEYTGETLSRAEEILKCISQGEKYEVDEWTYEHVLSRVEKLLTDWANKEDPEYTKTVSGILIHVLDAVEKPADSLIVSMSPKQEAEPWIDSAPDTEPYLSRIIPRGNRSSREFHGGTIAWNQLVQNGNFESTSGWSKSSGIDTFTVSNNVATLTFKTTQRLNKHIYRPFKMLAGHKYYFSAYAESSVISTRKIKMGSTLTIITTTDNQMEAIATYGTDLSENLVVGFGDSDAEGSGIIRNVVVHDLTQMFANNPAIADYTYSLEQATAGAGVAWLKNHGFIDDKYHEYDPGSLKSVNISALKIIDTDLTEHTYPLTSTDLRGLFKLDAQNKLYTDGDVYTSDGTVTRNIKEIALGDYNWNVTDATTGTVYCSQITDMWYDVSESGSVKHGEIVSDTYAINRIGDKAVTAYYNIGYSGYRIFVTDSAMSGMNSIQVKSYLATKGTKIVYKLATPTTETALAFTNPQIIEAGGREEFVDSRDVKVPVGNSTIYSAEYEVEGYDNITVYHAQNEQAENPTEYSISFALQGDVYSGTFDIVTGILSITMAEVDLGSLNWYSSSSKANTFYAAAPLNSKPATSSLTTRIIETQVVCDKYAQVPIYDLIYDASVKNKIAFCNLNGTGVGYQRLYVNNVMYSDAAVFKTAMNGTKCVYELAEPQTYQLTAQEVQMLLGENTLWTDDNLNLQLTYKGSNPAIMMSAKRAQNNILKKQGLKPIEEPFKPLDPIKPIIKK